MGSDARPAACGARVRTVDCGMARAGRDPGRLTVPLSPGTEWGPWRASWRMRIIGIDCATDPTKVGLAVAEFSRNRVEVSKILKGTKQSPLAQQVFELMAEAPQCLLALDAPLGWPSDLGNSLAVHRAGEPISQTSDLLFRRLTDRVTARLVKHQPLDVGADRIARTAHAALRLLGDLRGLSKYPIPLAWTPGALHVVSVVEVYPAATLASYSLCCKGYKGRVRNGSADLQRSRRLEIARALQKMVKIRADVDLDDPDCLDAVVCVVAGADFMMGRAAAPTESQSEQARKEGWIWVRRPDSSMM
jgi:hypothetical protein